MSRFTFIASDCELPEIDLSGIIRRTVKDLKEMNPKPKSFWDLDKLPDDCKTLFIPDGADTTGLQISICTKPPNGIEEYIKKKYIYWLGGKFNLRCKRQFQEYLQDNFLKGVYIELWSLWLGINKMDEILKKNCDFSEIQSFDFEILWNTACCITIIT
ncbi:hypothetical protein Desaci_0356 [Desulfosporosinus acidiphilus SJ4]|uniref:Uncharacterized protein n=1 Tax=Desulfosporosinus acidiphilus (strain DSM 22704 / JCM 16185 / SJ4) TaxID=646529 RepID=I4D0V0_DESAJ|nr:hypothetical protein [Desulfosporosinus acidiphilus]AFM39424.1 hypothetical protein Desaci_0356 [Desulfosporosinus acidiphilus SJ4]